MAESLKPGVSPADQRQTTESLSVDATAQLTDFDPVTTAPMQWGEFQLLQRIGQGTFGEVYRAWDPVLEREIALKLLLPQGLNPEQEYASIVLEARAIARVRHSNIVSIYGVDRRGGRVGFWSDFVRGQTLGALVATRGPMDAAAAARIGVSLCDALAAVHKAGLIHRDIKASNAMRDENGRALLMDFGLSRDLHRIGDIAGTPSYMAPELRVGEPASVQSDIYAMGVLLRFLTTGEVGTTPKDDSKQVATSVNGTSAGLEQIIQKATCRDPKLRYAGASQMAEALLLLLEPVATDASIATGAGKRRRLLWLTALVVLLALGIAAAGRIFTVVRGGTPRMSSPAYQDYLAAEDALLRYDKPGNTDKAISLYQETLERSPNFALAEAGLARAYWRKYSDTSDSKWVDAANQSSARAMAMNPNLAAVQMTAGMIHVDEGKFDVGLQELQQANQLDGMSAPVHAALGQAYEQQGNAKLADAKHEYQNAIDLAPDDWRWPYLLAAMQLDSGDFKSAEQNLTTALAKTPDNARILYNLGLVYQNEDRLPEAQKTLQTAIALNPSASSLMALGSVFVLQGKYPEAIDAYRRAVEMSPADWSTWGNLAAAYQWSGQYPRETTEAYKKAISLALEEIKSTPNDKYLVSVVGKYYAHLHDGAHAIPYLRKSLLLAPSDPAVIERVGESYEALGNRSEALKLIARALNLGFSVGYAKSDPALKALRQDPAAPEAIRDSSSTTNKNGGSR